MTQALSGIAERLANVRERILHACNRCGRDPAGVRLVAVSKTVEPERIREAREKIPLIDKSGVSWHYIGHLQTNKAKYAAALFDMVHSLDSLPLAQALNREAEKNGRVLQVLVQVNIADEQTKSGCEPGDAAGLIAAAANLQHLRVQGLMSMPPPADDPEQSRPFFSALRRLRDDIARQLPGVGALPELSMGMSADFETAIEEGATLVRVGTLIFGDRPYY